jgi:hypothetical protein
VTRRRVLAARALAVLADGLQLGLLPLFVGGSLSLVNGPVIDVTPAPPTRPPGEPGKAS